MAYVNIYTEVKSICAARRVGQKGNCRIPILRPFCVCLDSVLKCCSYMYRLCVFVYVKASLCY